MSFRGRTTLTLITLLGIAHVACGSCDDAASGDGRGRASSGAERGSSAQRGGDPRLPGVSRVDRQLQQELGAALQSQGKDYEPRTHHLDDDGRPVYTNRLIRETSPYLLQHAHNPVNWFPWGEEALEKAKREDKPIFLSVGYSTCHWCHVMERESFEDEETARYINEHFVPIKVDREERPDIDDIYMKAVHLMRGRGGWPMTVVLTPDREPFFGGTYFPRARLMRILRELVERYETEREEVAEKAERLAQRIRRVTAPGRPAGVPGPRTLVRAAEQLAERFEPNHGGFGRAPKFPQPARLKLLLRYYRRSEDPGARHMLVHTLESMASGGIHDHVGGGFHRYSTDAQWLVPHFEKMLYTNAQLADVYLEGWQATGHGRFAEVARAVLDYVSVEMTSPEGGFYSATDADSPTPDGEEEEGYFFTWTPAEIERVVRPERARLVAAYYGVREQGNFEGRNIFHTPRPIDEVARESGIEPAAFRRELEQAREQLYQARLERAAPHRDGKILTAWNALMASAFARGALALDHDRYATAASEAAQFLWTHLRDDAGRLLRSYKDGEARHRAYLIDYAAFIRTALDLYEVTSKPAWLDRALALQKQLDAHYLDDERGAYFRTADDHEQLLTRQKPGDDGSVPSGNSLQAHNLLRLFELTGNDQWNKRAEDLLSAFGRELRRHPSGRSQMLVALDFYLDVPLEIAIVSPEGQEPHDLLNELRQGFVPNGVLVNVSEADLGEHEERVPLLEGKTPRDGKPTAYVCERGRCELPTNDAATFARQVRRVRRPLAGERVPPLDVAGK